MVTVPDPGDQLLGDRLLLAFNGQDFAAFSSLLADDVVWGTGSRGCSGRGAVLAAFTELRAAGVTARITEMKQGSSGIACRIEVDWPEGHERSESTTIFQVYSVSDGRVAEISGYDGWGSAADAASVAPAG